jgi:plastocyanin
MGRILAGGSVWRLVSLVVIMGSIAACGGGTTTRTGAVHDIRVTEGPDPADLVVNPGDEVRWVNARTGNVRVDLVMMDTDQFSCSRGFSNMLGMAQDFAEVRPNSTASACFSKPGVIKYNLRMETTLPGGRAITSGLIRIGS